MRTRVVAVLIAVLIGGCVIAVGMGPPSQSPESHVESVWKGALADMRKILYGYEDPFGTWIGGLAGELGKLVDNAILERYGTKIPGLPVSDLLSKKEAVEESLKKIEDMLAEIELSFTSGLCPGATMALFLTLDDLMAELRTVGMHLTSLKGELEAALWGPIIISDATLIALDLRIAFLEILRGSQELLVLQLNAYGMAMELKLGLLQDFLGMTLFGPPEGPSEAGEPRPSVNVRLTIDELIATGNDEVLTIKNIGSEDADLTDWQIVSVNRATGEIERTFTFPSGYILPAGGSVDIHSGPQARENPPSDLLWTHELVWGDKEGKGQLLDSRGNERSATEYWSG